jgi:hypothetical protein
VGVGEVLSEAWDLYTKHAGRLILIAAVVFGLLSLVYAAVDAGGQRGLLPLSAAATIFGVLTLQGVLTLLVDDLRHGRVARSPGSLLSDVSPLLLPLLVAELIASVAIVGGFILFIVPGLVLLTFWSGFIPAIVLERRGMLECFRRSQYLVSGNFLKVLVVIVLTIAVATIVATVILTVLSPLPRYVDVYVAGVIANSITMPFVAVAWTIMFFELRAAKEAST